MNTREGREEEILTRQGSPRFLAAIAREFDAWMQHGFPCKFSRFGFTFPCGADGSGGGLP
jgi:hypothetical protein